MIGYYAHQYGSGHVKSAFKMAGHLEQLIVLFTSLTPSRQDPYIFVEKLATENPDGTAMQLTRDYLPRYLHYSPIGQRSIQKRSRHLLNAFEKHGITLLIIDVSVEIAALCKVSSLPYLYVRLPGNRTDEPHLDAYRGAIALIAYFPKSFEHLGTPRWVVDKTIYLGFLNQNLPQNNTSGDRLNHILILSGQGENKCLQNGLPKIAHRFKSHHIKALGNFQKKITGIDFEGFQPQVHPYLHWADLVVSNCGLNNTSEIIQRQLPWVAIPEERPFEEQLYTYQTLLKNKCCFALEEIEDLSDGELLRSFPKLNLAHRLDRFKNILKPERILDHHQLQKLIKLTSAYA